MMIIYMILIMLLPYSGHVLGVESQTNMRHVEYQYFHSGAKGTYDFEVHDDQDTNDRLLGEEKKLWYERIHPFPFNTIIHAKLFWGNNDLIFQTSYSSGPWGFRKVPQNNLQATKHMILSGDSNIYGVGINDSETLPQRMAEYFNNYYVYNWGLISRGPSNLLYLMENYSMDKMHPQFKRKGVMIYTFYYYLIERIIGSQNYINWGDKSPNYEIDKNGKVFLAGTFEDRPITKLYKFINKYSLLKKLIPNLPRISSSDIVRTAKIMARIKEIYLKQTDTSNKFVVVLRIDEDRNMYQFHMDNWNLLIQELRKEKIDVITVTSQEGQFITNIKGDGHMDANGVKIFATILKDKLATALSR